MGLEHSIGHDLVVQETGKGSGAKSQNRFPAPLRTLTPFDHSQPADAAGVAAIIEDVVHRTELDHLYLRSLV